MVAWLQDQAVTATLKVRFPLLIEEEEAWLRRMASSRDDVLWAIEREGAIIGVSSINGISWSRPATRATRRAGAPSSPPGIARSAGAASTSGVTAGGTTWC